MKNIWKFLCVLSMLVLMPEMAVDATTASPEGAITIHKYELPDGVDEDDDETRMAGADMPEGTKALSGISFRVDRVADNSTDPKEAEVLEGADKYSQTKVTDGEGMAVFDGLAYGVYLVTELSHPLIEAPVTPFLVRVPMTNPSGDGLIYNVHVYPKNKVLAEDLSIDKTVSGTELKHTSVKIGQEITWYISIGIPTNIATAQQFDIADHIGDLMAYKPDSVEAAFVSSGEDIENDNSEYYTISPGSDTITISFTETGRTLLGTHAGEKLQITLKTTLKMGAAGHIGEEIRNGASAVYTNSLDKTYRRQVQDEPYVVTGGARIHKEDENGDPLGGAVFKVYDSKEAALAGEDAIEKPGGGEWVLTTDGNGKATFAGLAYDEYWIVETQAPEAPGGGYYNLPAEPFYIHVKDGDEVHDLNVVNTQDGPGFVLPVTGGRGTLMLTLTGVILIGLALLLFLAARRKNSERSHED